jgi:hypothetical protein
VRLEQNLSASDRRRVEDALKRFAEKEARSLRLSDLLDEWNALAVSIAMGEDWSLAAYNRGLRTRDLIEEINEGLSMEGRRVLQEILADSDNEFIEATYDPLKPDSKHSPTSEIGWWQFRIPKDPRGRLQLGIPELGMGIHPPNEEAGGFLPAEA